MLPQGKVVGNSCAYCSGGLLQAKAAGAADREREREPDSERGREQDTWEREGERERDAVAAVSSVMDIGLAGR